MKIEALPSRYHGLIKIVMAIEIANARLMETYFGSIELISLPAGRPFSKIHENMAE